MWNIVQGEKPGYWSLCVCLEGNSPEQKCKVPKLLLSEIKEVLFRYNQQIGLEAAIFLRPRNRALVKKSKLSAPKIYRI